MATQMLERPVQRPTADLEALFPGRYLSVYRLVMLGYRLGRRLRGKRSVADGAALAITLE